MCKDFLNVNTIWDWFIIVLNTTIKYQIRTSLLMLSYLYERDKVSAVRIFSFLVFFPIRSIRNLFFFGLGSKNNIWYYLIGTQMSPALININVWGPWVSWPTFDCHRPTCSNGASALWKVLPDQVFLKVPSILFLAQHSLVMPISTTLSPANSVDCYHGGPRNGLAPHCPARDGSLCPFVLSPLKFQKPPVLSPLW